MRKGSLIKTPEELEIMREGGQILAEIVELLKVEIKEGNTSLEVDKYANFLCKRFKVKPAFLHYNGFPYTICANLNEIVVHGFPNRSKFKEGDIFGLDMGIIHHGLYLDMSYTVEIGYVEKEVKNFLAKTFKSMSRGIEAARPGNCVGDITFAMNNGLLDDNFSLMRDFIGHGIGHELHEDPDIPGIGLRKGEGLLLEEGMVLAIESISVMSSTNNYEIDSDGWTVFTKGKKYLSGLYEHTIIVTKDGPEIITTLD